MDYTIHNSCELVEREQLAKRTASSRNNANDQNQQTMESKMHNYKQPNCTL